MKNQKHQPNQLINATSPYLLQHAYNPVDWFPWGKEALEKAKKLDKPILVSIGYSACHWCHVMEKESFESEGIANIMNEHFINIKVDREERPDIDQVYMEAVSAMGINGGWPLNVFLTPDQKPFYGGTYFPEKTWQNLLLSIHRAYTEQRDEIEKSASQLTASVSASELEKYGLTPSDNQYTQKILDAVYQAFSPLFDRTYGGLKRAPKFPMPTNWIFTLRYYQDSQHKEALEHTLHTLDKMAMGGIYDHLGGGFARYSTDEKWFAPHFEKMLYDNGQLLSLYAEAYAITKNPLYKDIIYETTHWLKREMMNDEGGFYSAIDADSEGIEGKFYVWRYDEFSTLLKENTAVLAAYFGVLPQGNWEDGNNILHKTEKDADFINRQGLSSTEWIDLLAESKATLLNNRNTRKKPAVDEKILAGWNGITLKGLTDAYNALGDEYFLKIAIKNAGFISNKMIEGNTLYRSYKNGHKSIPGYLEDYAYIIQAFIALYECTFHEPWLDRANQLTELVIEKFLDEREQMFFFTANDAESLIARKKELFDNVIPASNSQMAINLQRLGTLLDRKGYIELADNMLGRMKGLLTKEPAHTTNWATLYSYKTSPTAEVVIVGEEAEAFRKALSAYFIPNKVIMGTKAQSDLPLMKNRHAIKNKTTIYVCFDKTCKLPVDNVKAALELIGH